MPFLELIDETLDINSTENYEVSVQAANYGLSCSILDTLRNKFVLLRSYEPDEDSYFDPDKLSDIISHDDFLIRQFRKTNIIIPSPKSTLIPAPLYDSNKKEEYFAFNQIRDNGEIILEKGLPDPDAVVLFSLPVSILDLLKKHFPEGRFFHHLEPLFQYIHVSRRAPVNHYIHVHLEKDYFNLIIYDQTVLKFCNTFNYKTISDIQYYVLYVLKRMNVSQGQAVNLSGKAVRSREIVSGFSDYIKTVRFAEPSGNFTFSYVFTDVDLYWFLNLFNVTNCE